MAPLTKKQRVLLRSIQNHPNPIMYNVASRHICDLETMKRAGLIAYGDGRIEITDVGLAALAEAK
jgi:hypothetical protein